MFLTKKHLDRRTFLRGIGATVALPLLDAMIPARTLWALTAGNAASRLAFVYFPHGAVMDEWTPPGADLELGRILQPLAPFRDRLTVVSGLENRDAYGPVHALTPGTWLGSDVTADQVAAKELGHHTLVASISVATEEPRKIGCGFWDSGRDASYATTISFRGPNLPVPMQFRPREVFDTLFQKGPGAASVLDRVADDTARVRARLRPADRAVLADYLEHVRSVERRVESAATGIAFAERMALMFDLVALAFRADITRVASVMMAAEASSMTYDQIGIPDPFHLLSHHQNDPNKIEKLIRIQAFHTRLFAEFIRTLAEQPDGDGSLLDRSLILFGSNMSDSHAHDHFPLPLAVVGDGRGASGGGRHLRYPDRTPISNLLVTMLTDAGVRSGISRGTA